MVMREESLQVHNEVLRVHNETLRDQNSILAERNIELQRLLGIDDIDPGYGLELTLTKRKLLSLLLRREVVTYGMVEAALPYAADARSEHLYYVHMTQLRKKLPPGVEIKSLYGVGYYIPEEQKHLISGGAGEKRGAQTPGRADGLSGHSAETGRLRVRDTESGEPAHQ
jgi:DNA-binding response OmpR family regulator